MTDHSNQPGERPDRGQGDPDQETQPFVARPLSDYMSGARPDQDPGKPPEDVAAEPPDDTEVLSGDVPPQTAAFATDRFETGGHGTEDTATSPPPDRTSGFHPVNIGHLVMGVAFLGLFAVWALYIGDVVDLSNLRWLLPVPWVVAGALGLLALALRSGRRDDTAY